MKTILFELHHLGDAVLSIPFVRAMSREELHVVCRASSIPIFRSFLPSERIHSWEPWWEMRGLKRQVSFIRLIGLLGKLRSLRADHACCVWADSRVHWLMRRTGARNTVGFKVNAQNFYAHERPWRWRRMKLGQLVALFCPLSQPLDRHDYQQSHLADWEHLAQAFGKSCITQTPWFDTAPHPNAAGLRQPDKPLWLIHPGGRLPTKRWPIERFQRLLDTHFADASVLTVAPPDSPALTPSGPHHTAMSAADFDELLSWVQSADAVLCNDSLVSHLAAALGKPVWTIFGSGNPNWFAPFQNAERVIASDACSFRPCIDRCVHSSPICLEAVTVTQVITALKVASAESDLAALTRLG